MIAAALVLFAAAVAIFTPGVARILRTPADVPADRSRQPDYDSNVRAFDRMGVRR